MLKYNKFLVLMAGVVGSALLVGCSAMEPVQKINRAPSYERPKGYFFGNWVMIPKDSLLEPCVLQGNVPDMHLTTDGDLDRDGMVRLHMVFDRPLAKAPVVGMTSYPTGLPLEGKNGDYVLYIAYNADTVAHMLRADTFLTIQYALADETSVREANLDTAGLVQGIAALGRYCQ